MLNRYKAMQEKALQEENERKEKMKAKVKEIQEKNKDTLSSVSEVVFEKNFTLVVV
ncbi:hypothetical protein DPMN_040069 [Dreissena polymorpha]|uniref:Uncharacterized protein n=1 Tax=Dreissena polymorpha TaxID=45954 RepID=A0A9D4CUK1_DREPO|nr:hypothetical protein DPMN_040069 [Dreissena polymorpha]